MQDYRFFTKIPDSTQDSNDLCWIAVDIDPSAHLKTHANHSLALPDHFFPLLICGG